MNIRIWKTEDAEPNAQNVRERSDRPQLFTDATGRGTARCKHIRASQWLALGFLIPAFAFCLRAWGQDDAIDWYKLSGGGGTSSNGQFAVSGTVGQPDAGEPMVGGNYSLTGGFWALVAVQTPGAPWLKISMTTTDTAMVSWPYPATGWNLQQNRDLGTTNWTTPSEMISNDGTNNFIIVNPPTGNRYYRLFKP